MSGCWPGAYVIVAWSSPSSRRARRLTHQLNMSVPQTPQGFPSWILDLLAAFGDGSEIRPPFYCDYGYQTSIGARCFVNWGLVSLDVATVTIGDDVDIGPNVQLLTATHPINPGLRLDKWEAAEPIVIMDNVWLGGGVIVGPGVTIGTNTVVGAARSWSVTCLRTWSLLATRLG